MPQPVPQPAQPIQSTGSTSSTDLEAIFAQFRDYSNPAPVPQPAPYDQSILTALNIFNQQQAQAQPVYNPIPAVQPQAPDFSSVLAQFNQQANNQPQAYNYQQMYQPENERKRQYDSSMQQSYGQYGENAINKRAKVSNGKKVSGDLG